jgi:large subunit ribosomal protein L24
MRIRKNDTVLVLTGKDRNRRGKVLDVEREKQRVVVEGVNVVKRHVKAGRDQKAPQGGIIEVSASIHMSNVRLICSKCNQPTVVGLRKIEGKKVRFCKKCNESIDK